MLWFHDIIWFHSNEDYIACSGFGRSATSRYVRSPATGFITQEPCSACILSSCACTQARPWQRHLVATLPGVCWGQPQAAGGSQSHPNLKTWGVLILWCGRSSKIRKTFQAVVSLMSGGGVGVGDRLDTLDNDLVKRKFWCTNSVKNSYAQIVLILWCRNSVNNSDAQIVLTFCCTNSVDIVMH